MKGTITSDNGLGVNFRSKPSTSASTYGKLAVGTIVDIEDTLNGWYKVSCNGKTGYIMAEFLSIKAEFAPDEEEPAEQMDLETRVGRLEKRLDMLWNEFGDKLGFG